MATDSAVQTPAMTIEAFKATPEFLALTENQKLWILKLIATNDARQATLETYPNAKKLGSAYTSQLAGKLLSSVHVRTALARFYGWSDREKFLNDLEHQIRKAHGADKVSLLALKARMLGLTDDSTLPAADEKPTYELGATLEQSNGKRYRVVAEEIA